MEENKEKKIKAEANVKIRIKKFKEFLKKYSVMQYISIGIAIFFLSMLLVAQVKTVNYTEEVIKGKRETQLAEELISLQSKYDSLKEKYEKSQEIVEEYKTNASSNNTLIESMKDEISVLSTISGATDVKGEGIVITLVDGAQTIDTTNVNTLVHDSDLLTVVNELKAAGAEAISINGQRIISTSAIRCVGPVIQVNYQKVATPFEIKAIGNAAYLESAMNIKNGIVDTLREYGIGITVSRNSEITIPKYDGTLSFKTAIVVK